MDCPISCSCGMLCGRGPCSCAAHRKRPGDCHVERIHFLLVRVVRSGRAVSCACFGAASAGLVTATTVARNVGLLVLAVVAGFSPSLIDLPANAVLPMLLLDAGIIVVGLLAGALIDIQRITGAMFPTIRAEA